MHRLKDRSGMALLLTLFAVSFIIAMTMRFTTSVRLQLHSAVNLSESIRLDAMSRSGLNLALYAIEQQTWLQTGDTSFTSDLFSDGRPMIELHDEFCKIQINALVKNRQIVASQRKLWQRFLRPYGLDTIRINTILTSIKENINTNGRITDLEFLESLEEMGEIYPQILPYITIYIDPNTNPGAININEADLPVLLALGDGITKELANDIIEYREDEVNKATLSTSEWYTTVFGGSGVTFDSDVIAIQLSNFVQVAVTSTVGENDPEQLQRVSLQKNTNYDENRFTRTGKGIIKRGTNKLSVLEWHVE